MREVLKIAITFICLLNVVVTHAQFENGLFSYSNPLLLNPSYAGLKEYTSIWTGLEVNRITQQQVYNQFSFTYDKYSRKLKGGVAWYLQQGLIGELNINTTEAGFTFAKQIKKGNSYFIPSVNLNLIAGTKQWFVQLTDELLDKQYSPYSPPGYETFRYYAVKPRIGFLWSSPDFEAGMSAMVPIGRYIAAENQAGLPEDPVLTAHLSQNNRGRRKGLISEPVSLKPFVQAIYSKNLLLTRTGIKKDYINKTYTVFLQNNFTSNIHMAGGGISLKFDNLNINLFGAAGIPYLSDKVTYSGEVSLALNIPPLEYWKINPWAPRKNIF